MYYAHCHELHEFRGIWQLKIKLELNTFGRGGVVLRPIVGAFGEISSHADLLADAITDALTAEHPSYNGDRGSKTAKAYYRRVLYRAWGLTAHRGWARLMLDRRSLVQAPGALRGQSQRPRARDDYDEETAYESYMNPEPGFQSGPGDSADEMGPCLLVTKSSHPSGGGSEKKVVSRGVGRQSKRAL